MTVTWKLALAYAVRHPARTLLTSLAMIASACVVVWVVSTYDALCSQFGQQAAQYLGRYDFFIVPEDANDPTINAELVGALRRDPLVAEVATVSQTPIRIVNPNAPPGEGSGMEMLMGGGSWQAGGPGAFGGPGRRSGPPQGNKSGAKSAQDPAAKKNAPPPKGRGRRRGGMFGMSSRPTLVGADAENPPYPMVDGKWIDPARPRAREAVITKDTAEQLKVKPGDDVLVIFGMKEYRIKIVGVLDPGSVQSMGMSRGMRPPDPTKPKTGIEAGPASAALYVSPALAKYFTRGKARLNLVNIQLKPEAKSKIAEFRKKWGARIAQAEPVASLLGIEDIRSGIEEGMTASRSRQYAWAATGMALLASLFIIFTTLSMGVTERVRQFAVMRAVGLTRGQVARVIAAEGLILALIGWAGGLLAGWGIIAIVTCWKPKLFPDGALVGTWCIALTGLSMVGGALAASLLPAWRANSVQPLEAMAPRPWFRPNVPRAVAFGVLGLALIAVNPILVYVAAVSMSTDALYYSFAGVGYATMAVGFVLLIPAAILGLENVVGPWLARLLGLEPRLLRSQLSGNLWRTLGTTAALTVGLGLFATFQIWGYSMLEPFKPGDWVPDMLVAFQRGGLPDSEIKAVQSIPGVQPGSCIPLAVEQPRLASDITGSEKRNTVISQNNVIVIGLDPEIAFGGADPLIKAEFVEGNPKEVVAKLKAGRNCIVPDHFLRATHLKLGDRFAVVPPETPSRRVEYTIVGAVSLPGWHWMTKFSGLRRREGRSAAIVFTDYDEVRRDYNLPRTNFFWMNVDREYGAKHLAEAEKIAAETERAAKQRAGDGPQPTDLGDAIDPKLSAVLNVGAALQPIAARNMGAKQPVNFQGEWAAGAQMFGESVRVSTPDEVRIRIIGHAGDRIWGFCYLPLITLVITSLGMVNTVMASVRARRWEFGVLRSQGVTRSGLFRMILAEGILIGLITCILSLAFGILAGWCGTGISQHVSFFGGLAPPLIIPWAQLSIGFGMALGLCLLAALWPAVLTGRAEPLKLLQAGRAAM